MGVRLAGATPGGFEGILAGRQGGTETRTRCS